MRGGSLLDAVTVETMPPGQRALHEGKDFGSQGELAPLVGEATRRPLSALAARLVLMGLADRRWHTATGKAAGGGEWGDLPAWRVAVWQELWR